jgi:ABC-type cobalamin/Fe3+-siderophores transport system ATPase subunit
VHAKVGLRSETDTFEWLNGYLAVKGAKDTSAFINQLLKQLSRSYMLVGELPDPFVTMLRDAKSYQQFVRHFGAHIAQQLALRAHDVSYALAQDRPIPRWKEFERSEVFAHAFMRDSEAIFAYDSGGAILDGMRLDNKDARQDFACNVQLGETVLEFDFQFRKGPIADNRIAALIGPNGAGKTASLIAINEGLLDLRAPSARITPRPKFNKVVVYADSRSLKRFAQAPAQDGAARRAFALDPKRYSYSDATLTKQLSRIIRESDKLENSLGILLEVIATEFSPLELQVPMNAEPGDVESTVSSTAYLALKAFAQPTGEQRRLERIRQIDVTRPLRFVDAERRVRTLSLGQDVFVSFVVSAIANAGPASAYLIDEPENYLHPNLISKFIRVLHAILRESRSIAIIATHSPYIVRELTRSQVHVLGRQMDSGLGVVEKPRMQTFGANVGAVSDDIFGDDFPEHLYVSLMRKSEFVGKPIEAVFETLKGELSLDALMKLRAMSDDPDLEASN